MDSVEVTSEERATFLDSLMPPDESEILPVHYHPPPPAATPARNPAKSYDPDQRLASLDVFRGLTVALMILVDDAGGAFPAINHAPWFGVTVADFVMPFFLFGVGVSVALVCRKATSKLATTRKVLMRTIKLFLLGVLLQGGYFHGRNHWTYGVDIDHIRWLGVLQLLEMVRSTLLWMVRRRLVWLNERSNSLGHCLSNQFNNELWETNKRWLGIGSCCTISHSEFLVKLEENEEACSHISGIGREWRRRISFGYFLGAVSEIWLTSNIAVDSPLSFMKKYYIQWIAAILLSAVYIALLFGVYVPNWEFAVSRSNSTLPILNFQIEAIHCGLRGSLRPPCNAVGFIDRLILGEKHLYQNPVYRRTKDCSINSPGYGPLPPNSPGWCLAPFDPEGILSSVMAVLTCFAGLQFGHVIIHIKSHMKRILLWSLSSLAFLLFAYLVVISGMPLSKPLYTLSYMFLTAGASGIALSFIYYLVDMKHIRKPSLILQWMGMNALVVYVLAACELFPTALQGFYWRSPSNNLVNLTESFLQTLLHSKKWGTLAFVLIEILFWCLVSGFLHMKGIYFKL